jgi:hypothetical protein
MQRWQKHPALLIQLHSIYCESMFQSLFTLGETSPPGVGFLWGKSKKMSFFRKYYKALVLLFASFLQKFWLHQTDLPIQVLLSCLEVLCAEPHRITPQHRPEQTRVCHREKLPPTLPFLADLKKDGASQCPVQRTMLLQHSPNSAPQADKGRIPKLA